MKRPSVVSTGDISSEIALANTNYGGKEQWKRYVFNFKKNAIQFY